jgi:hypothetical protein
LRFDDRHGQKRGALCLVPRILELLRGGLGIALEQGRSEGLAQLSTCRVGNPDESPGSDQAMIRGLRRGLEQGLDLFGRRSRSHEAPGGGLLTLADQFKRPIGGVEVIHVFRGVGIDQEC